MQERLDVPDTGAIVGTTGAVQRFPEQADVQLRLHASLQLHGKVLQEIKGNFNVHPSDVVESKYSH